MKLISALFLSFIFTTTAFASQFDDFNKAIDNNDYPWAKLIIDNWGEGAENDPQYYIAQFNYYFNISRKEAVGVNGGKPDTDAEFVLSDPQSGEVKGYVAPEVTYDKEKVKTGIDYIKQGIKKFPNHYEMRFGLLWLYKDMENFNEYLPVLEESLKWVTQNKPEFIFWNNNEKKTDVNKFLLENVQGNFFDIMNSEKGSMPGDFTSRYSDLMIQYFPDHKFGYTNKGVSYVEKGDLSKANEYFLKALKIDSNDALIAFNIGYCYKDQKDFANAKIYFSKVMQISKDKQFTDMAKKEIEELEKKGGK
jgi:tetratricopeptide (TPR) repeat protein